MCVRIRNYVDYSVAQSFLYWKVVYLLVVISNERSEFERSREKDLHVLSSRRVT